MAKVQKRNLNTTRYPEPGSPAPGTNTGVGTGQPAQGARQGLSSRVVPQGLQQKAHDFGVGRREKKVQREARGRNADPVAKLQADTDQARSKYLKQMRASGITSPGQTQDAQRRKMRRKHSGFAAKMARVTIGTVKLGLLPKRLAAKVTLGTAMWALSPKRRGRAGGARPGILAAATNKVKRQERREARIVDKGEVSRQKETERLAKKGEGRESMSGRHRRRLERVDQLERDNRDPFTEHSAALTHVGILQNAHDEMRRPGADRAEVRKQYENALNLLYSDVQADGLDRAAVERSTRVIAGQLMERDPSQAATFAELGHGQLSKSDPQTVRMPGDTETAQLWTGDYDDKYNGTKKSEGAFTPREPMGPEGHRSAVARTMYGDLASAKSPAELDATMKQYAAGADVRKHPEMAEMTGDPEARARMSRSAAMDSSMRADGLTDQQRKLVYMNGLQDSVRNLERTHPEKAEQFRRTAGPEWAQQTRDLAGQYRESGQKAVRERGQRPSEPVLAGPDTGSLPEPYEDYVSHAEVVSDGPKQNGPAPQAAASRGGPDPKPVPGRAVAGQRGRIPQPTTAGQRGPASKAAAAAPAAAVPTGGSGRKKQAKMIEKMSDRMAKDTLKSARANNGKSLAQKMIPSLKVWRNRAGTLGARGRGQDQAFEARAREMAAMSEAMKSMRPQTQDGMHAMAYVRSLEKVVEAHPGSEQVVRRMVAQEGGDPNNWRQHEHQAAMKGGFSGPSQSTYQQEREQYGLGQATQYQNPGAATLQKQASARKGVLKKPAQVGADLKMLATRGRSRVQANQDHSGVQGPGYGG